MIRINDNGNFEVVTEFAYGDEYLSRLRSLVRLVQCVNLELVTQDVIFDAMSAIDDMLPDDQQASDFFKKIKAPN